MKAAAPFLSPNIMAFIYIKARTHGTCLECLVSFASCPLTFTSG